MKLAPAVRPARHLVIHCCPAALSGSEARGSANGGLSIIINRLGRRLSGPSFGKFIASGSSAVTTRPCWRGGGAGGSPCVSFRRPAGSAALKPNCSRQTSIARSILPFCGRFVRWNGGRRSRAAPSRAGRRGFGARGSCGLSPSKACRRRCSSRISAAPCGPNLSPGESPAHRRTGPSKCCASSPRRMVKYSRQAQRAALPWRETPTQPVLPA